MHAIQGLHPHVARAELHAGIRKITITHEDILAVIDGLVTPKDAIKAFKELIETRTAGAEGDNIRILIK